MWRWFIPWEFTIGAIQKLFNAKLMIITILWPLIRTRTCVFVGIKVYSFTFSATYFLNEINKISFKFVFFSTVPEIIRDSFETSTIVDIYPHWAVKRRAKERTINPFNERALLLFPPLGNGQGIFHYKRKKIKKL